MNEDVTLDQVDQNIADFIAYEFIETLESVCVSYDANKLYDFVVQLLISDLKKKQIEENS